MSLSLLFRLSLKFISTRKPQPESIIDYSYIAFVAPKTNDRGFGFYHWQVAHAVYRGGEFTLFIFSHHSK